MSPLVILIKCIVVVIVLILVSIDIPFPFVVVIILVGLDILTLGQRTIGRSSSFSLGLLLFVNRSILFN